MPSNSELDQIISEICCSPNCTSTKLCRYCVEDKQRLLVWRNREVDEAVQPELEKAQQDSKAKHHGDISPYLHNRMAELRAAHSSREDG